VAFHGPTGYIEYYQLVQITSEPKNADKHTKILISFKHATTKKFRTCKYASDILWVLVAYSLEKLFSKKCRKLRTDTLKQVLNLYSLIYLSENFTIRFPVFLPRHFYLFHFYKCT